MKKGRVEIDAGRCKACYLCIRACPKKILEKSGTARYDGTYPTKMKDGGQADCILCGNCYTVCPDCAITIYTERAS
jgi:2-oxoglutarate ferredoxin oxidoreductase subunit delta